jgi:diacylglycerol kinase (ATP)
MRAYVILNPYAGRWKALERRPEMESALTQSGVEYQIAQSEAPGHAIELAKQAALNGYQSVIAAGGDGTISEVVNGILSANLDNGYANLPSLGVMPLGTANDFVINMHLPLDLPGAAHVIAAGRTARIDLMKRLRGTIRYLAATLLAVAQKPEWHAKLEWENGLYEGFVSLVTIGNNPLTGGLFYMTPHADPFDGLLTFVYGHIPTRAKILSILPRTMKPGKGSYVEHPHIHEVHSSWLRITTSTPTPLHADGEIQTRSATSISYQIHPSILPLLCSK